MFSILPLKINNLVWEQWSDYFLQKIENVNLKLRKKIRNKNMNEFEIFPLETAAWWVHDNTIKETELKRSCRYRSLENTA